MGKCWGMAISVVLKNKFKSDKDVEGGREFLAEITTQSVLKKLSSGAGEAVLWLTVLAALSVDLSSISNAHIRKVHNHL